jgi:AraC-like DNA-binding protein
VDFCVNGNTLHAGPGDLAIFSCYEDHSVFVRSTQYQRFVLQLTPSADDRECPAHSLLTDRPAGFSHVISILPCREQITGIFSQLIEEYQSQQSLSEWMLQSLVNQLLIAVFRCTGLESKTFRDSVVSDLKRQFEHHFSQRYSLEMLARKYCISVSALSHRFQATTGTSVMDYMKAALEELDITSMFAEVADTFDYELEDNKLTIDGTEMTIELKGDKLTITECEDEFWSDVGLELPVVMKRVK